MTENGFVQEEKFLFLTFGNRTDRLRCNLSVCCTQCSEGFPAHLKFAETQPRHLTDLDTAAEVCFLCVWLPCFCTILTKEGDLWIGKSWRTACQDSPVLSWKMKHVPYSIWCHRFWLAQEGVLHTKPVSSNKFSAVLRLLYSHKLAGSLVKHWQISCCPLEEQQGSWFLSYGFIFLNVLATPGFEVSWALCGQC